MPKQVFFNISETKRNKILEISRKEFTTKTFEEVSVNSIIKEANISRGSFYTYFDDLEELFHFILEEVRNERYEYSTSLLKESNYDYFTFIKRLFNYDFDNYRQTGKYTLFRNYVHYLQTSKKTSIKKEFVLDAFHNLPNKELVILSLQKNNLEISYDEFMDLIELILVIMINTFLKAENEDLTKDQAIYLFNRRISYLEYGVKKGQ